MKLLLQRLIAWCAFLHAIMLVTLPFNILLSSKDGVLGKEPGLLDRGLFYMAICSAYCSVPSRFGFLRYHPHCGRY